MNINKYIAQAGLASRRGADLLIKEKRVKINDKLAVAIDKVKAKDQVFVDGKLIQPVAEKIYLAFNKPVGVITTTDVNSPNNIIDVIKYPKRIFPVGRLDVNTSGLILLTNDGDFAQFVTKSKQIEKEYLVTVEKPIDDFFLKSLENGLVLDGFKTLPAKTHQLERKTFTITIVEGKNRQVRRMCEIMRNPVVTLKRIRIGKLDLGEISEGKYIELDEEKVKTLFA